MQRLTISVVMLLLACGGSGSLNPTFNGQWHGDMDITPSNANPARYSPSLAIVTSGGNMVVEHFCPDGTGGVSARGEGNSATWSGVNDCEPSQLASCNSATLRFETITLHLNGLVMDAQGVGGLTGCNQDSNFTFTYIGRQ